MGQCFSDPFKVLYQVTCVVDVSADAFCNLNHTDSVSDLYFELEQLGKVKLDIFIYIILYILYQLNLCG